MKRNHRTLAALLLLLFLLCFGINRWRAARIERLRERQSPDFISPIPNSGPVAAEPDSLRPSKTGERLDGTVEIRGGPMYQFFAGDGKINPALLTLAGVDPARRDEFDRILRETQRNLAAEMETQAKPLPAASGLIAGYFIPGSPELADRITAATRERIRADFGEGAAKVLMAYLIEKQCFADFGRYDVQIEKRRYPDPPLPDIISITFTITDPATGQLRAESPANDREVYRQRLAGVMEKQIREGTAP